MAVRFADGNTQVLRQMVAGYRSNIRKLPNRRYRIFRDLLLDRFKTLGLNNLSHCGYCGYFRSVPEMPQCSLNALLLTFSDARRGLPIEKATANGREFGAD